LWSQEKTEILFGGGAGGGKTYLGCLFVITGCFKYPGSRWFIGRSVLQNLKKSTLLTFFDLLKIYGFKKDIDFSYNQQDAFIHFSNGSDVYLIDLDYYPSDPNYDRIGSTEFTGGFIDEANQIKYKCFEVLKARMRYKLTEFNILGKIFMSCNPAKNWVYSEFYKPWKDGDLEQHRDFIQALATDNPNNPESYIKSLNEMRDRTLKARLLFGDWEYEDDGSARFPVKWIDDNLFTSLPPGNSKIRKVITIDPQSGEKNTADEFAITVLAWYVGDRHRYVLEQEAGRGSQLHQLEQVIRMWMKHPETHRVGFEKVLNQTAGFQLAMDWRNGNLEIPGLNCENRNMPVVAISPGGKDKVARLEKHEPMIERGELHLRPEMRLLKDQLMYLGSKSLEHDDRADSLIMALDLSLENLTGQKQIISDMAKKSATMSVNLWRENF